MTNTGLLIRNFLGGFNAATCMFLDYQILKYIKKSIEKEDTKNDE